MFFSKNCFPGKIYSSFFKEQLEVLSVTMNARSGTVICVCACACTLCVHVCQFQEELEKP